MKNQHHRLHHHYRRRRRRRSIAAAPQLGEAISFQRSPRLASSAGRTRTEFASARERLLLQADATRVRAVAFVRSFEVLWPLCECKIRRSRQQQPVEVAAAAAAAASACVADERMSAARNVVVAGWRRVCGALRDRQKASAKISLCAQFYICTHTHSTAFCCERLFVFISRNNNCILLAVRDNRQRERESLFVCPCQQQLSSSSPSQGQFRDLLITTTCSKQTHCTRILGHKLTTSR